jgi:cytidylate kinase
MPTDVADKQPDVIITIDGPAGTGKTTVAHKLANRLGLDFLDTGAMYRAAALIAIEQEIDPTTGATVAEAVAAAGLRFDWQADPPRLMLGDRDPGRRIRELDVSSIVSIVAGQPELRRILIEQQQRIAIEHPRLVTEGRDQGSVVFPDAGVRFYLDAQVEVRARRRAAQLVEAGMKADYDTIVRDIVERDRMDSTRSDGPLVRPHGAVEVDTGDRTADEVVDVLERITREHFPDAGLKQ